jgi:L-fucono-1,5-lactonase
MPTADAHVHLFDQGFVGAYGRLLHDETLVYERLRSHFGIERALVVGYEGEAPYIGNNRHILELAGTRPWIAPVAFLRVEPAPSVETLRNLHTSGAIGYSLYLTDPQQARAVAAWPREVMHALQAQRAVISLNANPDATAALGPFVDKLAECAFLFSHLGLPGRFLSAPPRDEVFSRLRPLLDLARHDNVAVKFSGLYAISDPPHDFPFLSARPIVEAVLDAYGPSRLCWGSDFAPGLDFASFGQLADDRLLCDLSPADSAGVMGGNLLRLLPPQPDKE